MVAGDSHRPGLVAGVQADQEAGGIVDVLARVEHVLDAAEMRGMVAVVDLHAAKIDQRLALGFRAAEGREGFRAASGKESFSLYVQGVGLKATLLSGFGQADGIEDAGRYAIAVGGAQDLRLARIGGGKRRAWGQAR